MKTEGKHNCFPVKQYKYKGIPHVGIKGSFVGKCNCGKYLEYVNNNINHGWFSLDDDWKIKFIENEIENEEHKQ